MVEPLNAMLSNSISLALGVTFVAIAAVNVWLALQASVRTKEAKTNARILFFHRAGGYTFVALFLVMGYFMFSRLGGASGGSAPMPLVHLILAMLLVPLVFIKVLVARYYKNHYSLLLPLGLTIFVLSFVLIAVTAGPYLARDTKIENVSLDAIDQPPVTIDINQAATTMQQHCSRCHNLDRVVSAVKDAPGWLKTVKRMQSLPGSGISDDDATVIVSYLTSQAAPHAPDANMLVARALVDQRCSRCHSLDRVYQTEHTPEQWRSTVTRMVSYAAGSPGAFQTGEDQQIIHFLSATQTAEAVSQRKAQAQAASLEGKSLVVAKAAPSQPKPQPSRYSRRTVTATVFITCVGLSMLGLMLHRPGRRMAPSSTPQAASLSTTASTSSPGLPKRGPMVLQLVRIAQQTQDSKTLRFALAPGTEFSARPGQFLSFSFLFDGKKVPRCYSICSSPARTGYIEITPKRVNQGCVSVFLNDRAEIGLTVEANGPLGQFCFDADKHKRIVLIGAGSGITPLIAMLRYIDDLGLPTQVTLLYCVRTIHDVMFRTELEELGARLDRFKSHILLSQPHAAWSGKTGHINRDFITGAVSAVQEQDFFLCGPPPFMDAAQAILAEIGVKPERIHQENFGGKGRIPVPQSSPTKEAGTSVEFARSGKKCSMQDDKSLLELAEANGVAIPYSCRQGQCGTCKTRLLEGAVQMDAEQGLDPDSKARGFVLLCVGHPQGPVKLDA